MDIEYSAISALIGTANFLLNYKHSYVSQKSSNSTSDIIPPALYCMNEYRGGLAELCAKYYQNKDYKFHELKGYRLPLIIGTGDEEWCFTKFNDKCSVSLDWSDTGDIVKLIYPGLLEKVSTTYSKKIEDNPTYRLLSCSKEGNSLKVTCSIGSYGAYYETCEALSWETAENVSEILFDEEFTLESLESESLLSAYFANHNDDQFFEFRKDVIPEVFTNRDSTIGVNTLSIFASNEKPAAFILHERGGEVAEALGTLHVVPAGTFQPLSDDDYHHDTEFSLERTILRETAEELLNLEEDIRSHSSLDSNYVFNSNHKLKEIKSMYEEGVIKTYKLGFGLDPLTLKPEFLTIQIINFDLFKIEFPELDYNWEGKGKLYKLNKCNIEKYIINESTLPACAACLFLLHENYDYFESEIEKLVS